MTKKTELTQKGFDQLLNWLDNDENVAATKYRSIHQRLIQIFLARGAFPADELADRTIDRVIQRIDFLVSEYKGERALYFYSTANKIFFEHLRAPKSEPLTEEIIQKEADDDSEIYYECLNECLENLSPDQRELFVEYYQHRKQTKIDVHNEMAQKLGLDIKALRTRVYRIRLSIGKCVRKCVSKKNM